MMKTFSIKLRRELDDSYPVLIDADILPALVKSLKSRPLGRKYALVTDSRVVNLYAGRLLGMLCENGIEACSFYFPEGERSKCPEVWLRLVKGMIDQGYNRSDCVIALGGGVVGDLAGFVASSFMRGVPWVQVPTSLLAMADAGIGGKVGIDLASGKNLAGAFWQPKAVYIGLDFLKTLPEDHRLNGMAEMVKAGLIRDRGLFELLWKHGRHILDLRTADLAATLVRSLGVKAAVVEKDEREISGERKILNYGHTFGHALEVLSGYKLLHGFAVSFGMRAAARIAVDMGFLSESDAQKQNMLMDALGFPPLLSGELAGKIKDKKGREQFFGYLFKDKKSVDGRVEMVLLRRTGEVKAGRAWTFAIGRRLLDAGLEEILE